VNIDRLATARGFGRSHEREAAHRPGALDRGLALAAGVVARALDWPAWNRRLSRAAGASADLRALSQAQVDERLAAVRGALRRQGIGIRQAGPAVALVAEVAARTLGLRPHAEQRAGALLLLQGRLVEMDTGEGKSLTVALAAAVAALAGVPVEVFTVNDYLARRDAAHFAGFFSRLGLDVGTLVADDPPHEREAAYGRQVLYVVNKDYVFEHLRFRAASGHGTFAQRGLYFAIVDEADSILVDEARTPLIIARESTRLDIHVLRAVAGYAQGLPAADYTVDEAERRVTLRSGCALEPLRAQGLAAGAWPERLLREMVEQALAARLLYRRDRDYIVADGRVAIVDEYTGRMLADRSWEQGLHQFVELCEGLAPTPVRETIARTTFPEFFRRYLVLAGTSGTLMETAPELRAVYGVPVSRVPRHRPARRRTRGPWLYRRSEDRWAAVAEAVRAGLRVGRPVLVCTRSVAASESIAARLRQAGCDLAVLNAREHAEEAAIIAAAGRQGRVTVATNMAGRGTDIVIDDAVRAAGGLLVVLTELHESARIDRQLMGRCARQGDPGECVMFASLEDELFVHHLPRLARAMASLAGPPSGTALPRAVGAVLRRCAQALAEARHRAERAQILDRNEALGRQLGFAGSPP